MHKKALNGQKLQRAMTSTTFHLITQGNRISGYRRLLNFGGKQNDFMLRQGMYLTSFYDQKCFWRISNVTYFFFN